MSKRMLDLNLHSRNVIDKYMNYLERGKAKNTSEILKYESATNSLLKLERVTQDLEQSISIEDIRKESSLELKKFLKKIDTILVIWNIGLHHYYHDTKFVEGLDYHLETLLFSTETYESNKISAELMIDELINHFTTNKITFFIQQRDKGTRREASITYRSMLDDEETVSFIHSRITSKDEYKEEEFKMSESYEWDVKIKFNGDSEIDSSTVSFLIWAISSGLEQIDGVEVKLSDWGRGSFWVNLKIKFKDLIGRKEVKDVLDKGRKAAEAHYLDQKIFDAEKTKSEIEKNKAETERLLDKEDIDRLAQLEIRKKQLELREKEENIISKQIDNKLKQLEFINQVSVLIEKGLVEVDSDFQIHINDLLFLSYKDGRIQSGEPIELIDKKSKKKKKEDETNKDIT